MRANVHTLQDDLAGCVRHKSADPSGLFPILKDHTPTHGVGMCACIAGA
jgi:hypothetical protein